MLFVASAVCALDLNESMPQVEALRTQIRYERPQPQAIRPLALGYGDQHRADASARQIRIDVELLKPNAIEHE